MTLIRDKVLDKLLNPSAKKAVAILAFVKSKNKGVTIRQVEEYWSRYKEGRVIKKALKGEKPIGDNTIRRILDNLVLSDFLTREKTGKTHIYFYKDETDELKNNLFESASVSHLLRWAVTFNKYKGLPFIKELEEILGLTFEDLLIEYEFEKNELRPYIDFETNEHVYSGWGKNVFSDDITKQVADYLDYFYDIISSKNETVEFTYRSFQTGKISVVSNAKPYLLKEHAKRWYMIASIEDSTELRPFSLDRIIKINKDFKSKNYAIPSDFNPSEYWKECVGIFRDPINGAQKVSFELKNGPRYNNINYLISSPLHASQKAIHVDETWMRFEYTIHIGPEVIRHIRQWGLDNLRNIQPHLLDEHVRNG
jgi:hypothetical protein